jgi:hypothetical protein
MLQPDQPNQVQSNVHEVGQKIRDVAQSEQVRQATDKLKSRWLSLNARNKVIVICIGILGLLLFWRLLFGSSSNQITAESLQSVFDTNANAASKKYDDQILVITGKVKEVAFHDCTGENGIGETWVTLHTGSENHLFCIFRGRNEKVLTQLSPGSGAKIEGNCCKNRRLSGPVVIYPCVLK